MNSSLLLGSDQPEPFSFWWNHPGQWVEPANHRRGGWSGVLVARWQGQTVYIKRQQQHLCRDLHHPLGWPTACREYANLLRLQQLGIQAPRPICMARDGQRAVLVLAALSGYQALDQLDAPDATERAALASALGFTLGRLHRAALQHGCLYPKHIFLRRSTDGWQVALLDLEKMRQRWSPERAARHDLEQLQRHQQLFNAADWLRLCQAHERSINAPSQARP